MSTTGFANSLLAACWLVILSDTAMAVPLYRLTALDGGLGPDSYAMSISSNGYVTGRRSRPGSPEAFRYDGTSLAALAVGGTFSQGSGVNSRGTVVGYAVHHYPVFAFVYDGPGMQTLQEWTWAYAINNRGTVVGKVARETPVGFFDETQGFIYDSGNMTRLDPTPGSGLAAIMAANDINDAGWITGESFNTDSQYRAFVFDGTTSRNLGALSGDLSIGRGISTRGHVTGEWSGPDSPAHAFLFDGNAMRDLGTLGGTESWGAAVNASGHVVGHSGVREGGGHAFFFDGEQMLDLNDLVDASAEGWVLYAASDINDRGQIVGYGAYNGGVHAFLLTPVPEPATVGLALVGLGLLGMRSRARCAHTTRYRHRLRAAT